VGKEQYFVKISHEVYFERFTTTMPSKQLYTTFQKQKQKKGIYST